MTSPIASALAALEERALRILPGVVRNGRHESVGFQGGLGRRFVDARSDVDIVLGFLSCEDSGDAQRGELRVGPTKVSVFHLYFDSATPASTWGDKQRYVYGYETRPIVDPNGRLTAVCRGARLTRAEQEDRVFYKIKKLGNRGITYRGNVGGEWLGLIWDDSPHVWVQRGDLVSAHMRLNQSIELLIGLVFALNGQPVPSPKWRYRLAAGLPWVPTEFSARLRQLVATAPAFEQDFDRRLRLAVDLLTDCVDHALAEDLIPGDAGLRYRERHSSHVDGQ